MMGWEYGLRLGWDGIRYLMPMNKSFYVHCGAKNTRNTPE